MDQPIEEDFNPSNLISQINNLRSAIIANINAQHFPASLPRIHKQLEEIMRAIMAYCVFHERWALYIDHVLSKHIVPFIPFLSKPNSHKGEEVKNRIDWYNYNVFLLNYHLTAELESNLVEYVEKRIEIIANMDVIVEDTASRRRKILQERIFESKSLLEEWGALEDAMLAALDDALLQDVQRLSGSKEAAFELLNLSDSCATEDCMDVAKGAMILVVNCEMDKFVTWVRAMASYIAANKKDVGVEGDNVGGDVRGLKYCLQKAVKESKGM